MLSILNNERGGIARTKRSTSPCRPSIYLAHSFVLLVKQMFRTWGCVVVPCFCSEDIVRKLPSPEIIFQTPNHQKHDNESNVTCLGNPSKSTSSGFFPLRGYPSPPYPLSRKSFCQKNLSQLGGPPPPSTEKNR